ncbi:MAG: SHOCT domain-containing protein [Halobacteriaceae archaeon]
MAAERESSEMLKIALIILALLIILPFIMMIFVIPLMSAGVGIHMMGDGMLWGASPFLGLVMMVLWVLFFVVIGYFTYRVFEGSSKRPLGRDPALKELRMQYAQGEISEEEFEKRRRRLQRENQETED